MTLALKVSPRAGLWTWRAIGLAWVLVGVVITMGMAGRLRVATRTAWWVVFGTVCLLWGLAGLRAEDWHKPGRQTLHVPAGMLPFCWAGVSILGILDGILALLGPDIHPRADE